MFEHDLTQNLKNCRGMVLTVLGGALGATAFLTIRHARKKGAEQGRGRLGQAPSREHIRMSR
jgi:hypothetical protein